MLPRHAAMRRIGAAPPRRCLAGLAPRQTRPCNLKPATSPPAALRMGLQPAGSTRMRHISRSYGSAYGEAGEVLHDALPSIKELQQLMPADLAQRHRDLLADRQVLLQRLRMLEGPGHRYVVDPTRVERRASLETYEHAQAVAAKWRPCRANAQEEPGSGSDMGAANAAAACKQQLQQPANGSTANADSDNLIDEYIAAQKSQKWLMQYSFATQSFYRVPAKSNGDWPPDPVSMDQLPYVLCVVISSPMLLYRLRCLWPTVEVLPSDDRWVELVVLVEWAKWARVAREDRP